MKRIDEILAWDKDSIDTTVLIQKKLMAEGLTIGNNDTSIAGHAISTSCILVTNNIREFARVEGLTFEDWVH